MARPCYKFRAAVIADCSGIPASCPVTWERDVSEMRATQGGVRRSKRGHVVLGRCEIHEGFCENSELYREQSLQLRSRSHPGLHNQNKYLGAVNSRSAL